MISTKKETETIDVTETCIGGGYVCPHCKANILTPKGYILVTGVDNCPFCKGNIHISEQKAISSNEARNLMIISKAVLGI